MPESAADNPEAPAATAAAGPVRPPAHTPVITDVWSWTTHKYRIRAAASLSANFLLFSGLCAFTHWLHSGRLDFSLDSYIKPLRFWGLPTQNLYDFIVFPINVVNTQMHALVIGLLFATIVAVPISVAILYRLRAALPFLAVVVVLAHLPWMAVTLLGSCVLAAAKPFRMSFKFGSALVGMLPVLLYLYLATRGPTALTSASISPEQKLLLAAPWVLAILAACTMLAVIILLAWIVNYRPGVVAPVMALMFVAPVMLFSRYVGVDELHYRLLESQFGPRSERFAPVQDVAGQILQLVHTWTRPGLIPEQRREKLLALLSNEPREVASLQRRFARRLLLDLMDSRREAAEACRKFIADHPRSQYVPCALFIWGQALDTRLDERKLPLERDLFRELYTDFPHAESETVWKDLLTRYPHTPLAVAARRRFAQLRLRSGDAEGALTVLTGLGTAPDARSAAPPTQPARPLLRTLPPETGLGYDPDQDRFEAECLRELIGQNQADPKYGTAVLAELAGLDPHRPAYAEQLLRLAERYPDSRLYDDLLVRWAKATPDPEQRAAQLRACVDRFEHSDALAEALFELADLEVQAAGSADRAQRETGVARLRALVSRFPQSCWARRAAERLSRFDPEFRPSTQGTGP
ncbi:MAG: hypothetical protein AB1716_13570 [Planctomycetota bacterium]